MKEFSVQMQWKLMYLWNLEKNLKSAAGAEKAQKEWMVFVNLYFLKVIFTFFFLIFKILLYFYNLCIIIFLLAWRLNKFLKLREQFALVIHFSLRYLCPLIELDTWKIWLVFGDLERGFQSEAAVKLDWLEKDWVWNCL